MDHFQLPTNQDIDGKRPCYNNIDWSARNYQHRYISKEVEDRVSNGQYNG